MASLWNKTNMKLFTMIQKPSPNANLFIVKSTRISQVFSICKILAHNNFIKKLSLFIPCSVRSFLNNKLLRASMTVEAAIVVPIFIFFLMNIGYTMEIVRLHNNLQLALTIVGEKEALYGSVLQEGTTESVLTGIYAREAIIDYLDKQYLDTSPLTYGCSGLNFLESEMLSERDCLDITLTYSVSPLTTLAGFWRFRMANRYCVHRWNGYDVSGGKEDSEIVYVTENGRVWHLDRGCKHLCLSVRCVDGDKVDRERNASGARYDACERCYDDNRKDVLYIAKEGNRYHSREDCSGLKRTVYAVTKKEAEEREYRICKDCGKGEE